MQLSKGHQQTRSIGNLRGQETHAVAFVHLWGLVEQVELSLVLLMAAQPVLLAEGQEVPLKEPVALGLRLEHRRRHVDPQNL